MVDAQDQYGLTGEEWSILSRIADGWTTLEIARQSYYNMVTIKRRIERLYSKLKCAKRRRELLVVWYVQHLADRPGALATHGSAPPPPPVQSEPQLRLWLLRPVGYPKPTYPAWDTWYDRCFGMVVVAYDEAQARDIAWRFAGVEGIEVWRDPEVTTCTSSFTYSEPSLVLRDFRAG